MKVIYIVDPRRFFMADIDDLFSRQPLEPVGYHFQYHQLRLTEYIILGIRHGNLAGHETVSNFPIGTEVVWIQPSTD